MPIPPTQADCTKQESFTQRCFRWTRKKIGGFSELKKMGRPKTDKPKEIKYSIRTDEETERRLIAYCAKKGISKGEAYRKGIELLLEKE